MVLESGAGRAPRTAVKATQRREEAAARRREALAAQQTESRERRLADVRRAAMETLLAEEGQDEGEVEVEDDEDDEDADMAPSSNKISGKKMRRLRMLHKTLFFARQLQIPDWLLDMPPDLVSSWLVQVRPEGDRFLLLSDGGSVQVRRKNGHLLERYRDARFPHGLTILDVIAVEPPQVTVSAPAPAGVGGTASGSGAPGHAQEEVVEVAMAVEDGEVAEAPGDVEMSGAGGRGRGGRGRGKGGGRGYAGGGDVDMGGKGGGRGYAGGRGGGGRGGANPRARPVGDRKYAVCDVLVWGDTDLATADAECRMFWLESRFAELSETPASRRARPLMLTPTFPVTPETLSKCYHTDLGFIKDNFLFLHREGHYQTSQAVTPLALMWRDRQISRWVIDTPDATAAKVPERQAVVLELRNGARLRTADRVVIGQLDEQQLAQVTELTKGPRPAGKTLVRCEASAVDVAARQVTIAQVTGVAGARSRVWPDSWGRIAFQHLQRQGQTQHISFQALMRAAIGDAAPVAGEEK